MSIKYNRGLDTLALAANEFLKGNHDDAAVLFTAACAESDMVQGLRIIEASNAEAHASMIKAAASKVQAKKSPEDVALAALLKTKRVTASDEPEGEPEEVEDEAVEEEDEADGVEAKAFASLLKQAKKK